MIPRPCALAVLVEGKKVCGILGGGAADGAADTLSFIQEKNCWMPGGKHRPNITDRGRLGGWNKSLEQ